MLLKILLVLGVIAAVYFIFFKKSTPVAKQPNADTASKKSDDDTMVPCEACGVFVSVKEAFIKEGKYYCSKSCMEGA
ncbi:PP0621 family protein [Sulfurimonas sp. HSL1-2]|uniref:PP0621 family protein n=1 Tax=Thiomicrolovo zhangzhouensis TaxID=3131933 RepID=UPI0031F9A623